MRERENDIFIIDDKESSFPIFRCILVLYKISFVTTYAVFVSPAYVFERIPLYTTELFSCVRSTYNNINIYFTSLKHFHNRFTRIISNINIVGACHENVFAGNFQLRLFVTFT